MINVSASGIRKAIIPVRLVGTALILICSKVARGTNVILITWDKFYFNYCIINTYTLFLNSVFTFMYAEYIF